MQKFIWEDFDNSNLMSLKEKYSLEIVVENGKDDFSKQLLLKDWVYNKLSRGNPSKDYSMLSAVDILKDVSKGKKVHCTQYAITFMQCAISLGWYSRKLGVDTDHKADEKDQHHGVADIWSNKFNKWYVVDAMFNLHYEKDGIPLNSLEIRNEYLKNYAQDIKGIIGYNDDNKEYDEESVGNNTPSNYFWFFVSLRNNFFDQPGIYNTDTLLWIDRYNEDKVWYKIGVDGKPIKHPMYESQFVLTSDKNEIFPVMS